MSNCKICGNTISGVSPLPTGGDNGERFDCPYCGHYFLTGEAIREIEATPLTDSERYLVSHFVRREFEIAKDCITITPEKIRGIRNDGKFPNPATMSENLILWLGRNQASVGRGRKESANSLGAVMGVQHIHDVDYVLEALKKQEILQEYIPEANNEYFVRLSFVGWQKFNELESGITKSDRVFMAMQYDEPLLENLWKNYYKPVTDSFGFDLYPLKDKPKAGTITNHMRVAIKEAKFVIADVSFQNRGAYWEAGYAEGLNKHVIYSINKAHANTKDFHFDIKGQQTIIWEPTHEGMQQASNELKSIIQNTMFMK